MLPPKIRVFVNKLREATNNNDIDWIYDPDEAEVCGEYKNNAIKIRYRFDELSEYGIYYILITDKNGKQGSFEASQYYSEDYEALRILFDSAQAFDLDID